MGRPAKPTPTFQCKQCQKTCEYKRYGVGHKWHYDRTQEFCSHRCADLFQYRGGAVDKHGYRLQKKNGKYHPEHRLVMEQHLGRDLLNHETVHHKDGNRLNNHLSNLELWSSRHGKGQRVEDKIDFCLSFLQEYPEFLEGLGYRLVPVTQEETAHPQVYDSVNVLLM